MSKSPTLYWGSGSPFSFRALIALKEKKINFESKLLEFSKGEHKTPEMLKLNPRGKLPVLVHEDSVVCESAGIICYIDEAYPENPLMPKDNAAKAKVYQKFFEIESMGVNARQVLAGKMQGGESYSDEKFKADLTTVKDDLKFIDDAMGNDQFIAGDMFTRADVILCAFLYILMRFGATFDAFPKIKAYAERFKERDSIKEAWPPGWKETEPKFSFFAGHL